MALFKYAVVLSTGLGLGYWINGPISLEMFARLARIHETSIVVDDTVAPLRPDTVAGAVDRTAATRVDEDLDYLIAKRIGTLEGWRAFLAAHGSGDHALSAMAEIDKEMLRVKAAKPAAVEVTDHASLEGKAEREIAPSDGAMHPLGEVCSHDGGCRATRAVSLPATIWRLSRANCSPVNLLWRSQVSWIARLRSPPSRNPPQRSVKS